MASQGGLVPVVPLLGHLRAQVALAPSTPAHSPHSTSSALQHLQLVQEKKRAETTCQERQAWSRPWRDTAQQLLGAQGHGG